MPSIKIYPPSQLPDRGVTETQFNIWCEELEVYLAQEDEFAQFLPDGKYPTWTSKETNADRITQLHNDDQALPNMNTQAARAAKLRSVRTKLRTVLAIIGKCVSEGHYNSVIRHSTSLQWIYDTLRSDYDLQNRGIHFFNILEVKYDTNDDTPVSFYNRYRTVIVNNMSKNGDVVKYKNTRLTEDEKVTPMLEDLILLNVLNEIDSRLPSFIKSHYNHKMSNDDKLMDMKSDILTNVPTFLKHLNGDEQNSSFKVASFGATKQKKNVQNYRRDYSSFNKKFYCRMCYLEKCPRKVYTSHNLGDKSCPSVSQRDKSKFNDENKLSTIHDEETVDEDDELAEMFGYSCNSNSDSTSTQEEVDKNHNKDDLPKFYRETDAKCDFIQPVPSQIVTVFENIENTNPVHIDLDSGATLNYCTEQEVVKRGFKVYPNGQLSKLGDGITSIKAVGEIHETFFRNKCIIQYNAVVCKSLNSPFIGGTLFIKENKIEQDFARNVIHIGGRQITVQPTDPISLLPTQPIVSSIQVKKEQPPKLLQLKRRNLLPGQTQAIPVNHEEGSLVAVEPYEQNINPNWPSPHLQTVTHGKVVLKNTTNDAILLGSDIKLCKITSTSDAPPVDDDYYKFNTEYDEARAKVEENLQLIKHNKDVSAEANQIIDKAHEQFSAVFDKNLEEGYNGFYGEHKCYLNWASSERPCASKVKIPCYDHTLKGVQQQVMDDLT